ncbi:MAG: phosphatidate cytidylyltransferase [Phycisphaerae bacterium]
MLWQRLFFGAVLIAALIGLIHADDSLSESAFASTAPTVLQHIGMVRRDGLIVTGVLMTLIVLGTVELHRLFSGAGHAPLFGWPILINLCLAGVPFVVANGPPGDVSALHAADHHHMIVIIVIAFFGTALLTAVRRKTDGANGAMATTMLLVLYPGLLAPFILRLRLYGPPGAAWWLLVFIATVKVCDIGAYFTGLAYGRRKLIPWLSPGKTIEGLAGGVAASILFAMGVYGWASQFADPDSSMRAMFPSLPFAAGFGAVMALIGQAGDLLESLIKRDAGAKDSAAAVPAFGGVMDILDSLLPAAPLAYWMLLQ